MKKLILTIFFAFYILAGFSQTPKAFNYIDKILFNYQINYKATNYNSYSGINIFNIENIPGSYRNLIVKLRYDNNQKAYEEHIINKFDKINITNIVDIKELLLNDLKLYKTVNQDTVQTISSYLENFNDSEKIKKSYMFKAYNDRGSFSPGKDYDKLPTYLFICTYLDRISTLNIENEHLFLVLDLLNRLQDNWGDEINIYLKNNDNFKEFNYVFYRPILELLYNHWIQFNGPNLKGESYELVLRELSNGLGEKINQIDFNSLIVSSLFVNDKIRTDNPDFLVILKWMSENYEKFIDGSTKFPYPMGINFSQDGVGVISNFTLLNILLENGFQSIIIDGKKAQIEEYKSKIINDLGTYQVNFKINTATSNNCINKDKINFSFVLNPSFLFTEFKANSDDRKTFFGFDETISFSELDGKIVEKSEIIENKIVENLNNDDKLKRQHKNVFRDWFSIYLFGQSKNPNRSIFKKSIYEISEKLNDNNFEKLKNVDSPFIKHFSTDSINQKKLLNHIVNIAQANYAPVYFKNSSDNKSMIDQFLIQTQTDALKSKDSLKIYINKYLTEIVKSYLLPKPIDVLKKEWIVSFDNQIYTNKNQGNTYYGSTNYTSQGGMYYSGTSNLTIKSQNYAYYTANVYVEGMPINVFLEGKITRNQIGNYKFISSKGIFNLLLDINQCGKRLIKLYGTGKNSNISSTFTFE